MANEIIQTIKIEASLTKIQSDLKTLEGNFASSFSKISNIGKSALGTLGIGLGVAGLVAYSKAIIDLGDRLSDLSDQTGLSIQVLGGVRTIAKQNGSSLEAFAGGIAKAQKKSRSLK